MVNHFRAFLDPENSRYLNDLTLKDKNIKISVHLRSDAVLKKLNGNYNLDNLAEEYKDIITTLSNLTIVKFFKYNRTEDFALDIEKGRDNPPSNSASDVMKYRYNITKYGYSFEFPNDENTTIFKKDPRYNYYFDQVYNISEGVEFKNTIVAKDSLDYTK